MENNKIKPKLTKIKSGVYNYNCEKELFVNFVRVGEHHWTWYWRFFDKSGEGKTFSLTDAKTRALRQLDMAFTEKHGEVEAALFKWHRHSQENHMQT